MAKCVILKTVFYRSVLHHRQFRYLGALYLHSLVRLFAVSIFQIFSSIYAFQISLGFGISHQQALGITALFFALIFLVHALSVAPSLWLISKRGLRFSVFWGNICLVAFFATFYLAKFDLIFLIIAAIFAGLQLGLYWTAYHIYLAELTDDKRQGEEIAIGQSLSAIAVIGGPSFGGMLIHYSGFGTTFAVMGVLVILANLPLKYLPRQRDTVSIDILKTVFALAPKEEKGSYFALMGAGVVETVGAYFWPLFIFPILGGFIGLGFVGSLIALIAVVTTISIGFLVDKFGPKAIINILSPLDSLVWILRIFATTPLRVFTASGMQALSTNGQLITLDSMIYERARHEGLVAFIVQREVGLAVGRFAFLLLAGILFWFGMPLVVIFILAAVAALLTKFYPAPALTF